jgi:hypothetical protein
MDNAMRADLAQEAAEEHARRCGNENDDLEAHVGDLLTNLAHLCRRDEELPAFDVLVLRAEMNVEEES